LQLFYILDRFRLYAKSMRNAKVAIAALVVMFLFTSFHLSHKPSGLKLIVIDAGHGGHDPGCQYGGVNEKNVTLSIALKLGKIIKEKDKDIKVIYTRTKDEFIELNERASIANRNNADVFISIHCNANPKPLISGTETYTMGLYKTEGNLDVAKRENSVILMEPDYNQHYDGFNPKSNEAYIELSLYQSAFMKQSIELAEKIEKQFTEKAKGSSRGIKQAGFLVLWKTTMPSVLVETGFLSNDHDRKKLNSDTGQAYIANGIFNALEAFKHNREKISGE